MHTLKSYHEISWDAKTCLDSKTMEPSIKKVHTLGDARGWQLCRQKQIVEVFSFK